MPQTPELEWRSYRDEENASVKAVGDWLGSLNDYQRESALGDIVALRERAAAGLIVEGDDKDEGGNYESLKPIRLDPDLYELRWHIFGRHLRQYHAEPKSSPRLLVDLHLHFKFIDRRSKRRTKKAQDAEISWALLRYRAGELKEWL